MNAHAKTSCRSSDEALDQLLEELTERIQSGQPVDIEACVAAHPEYADSLRRLLPAMEALVAFGGSGAPGTEATALHAPLHQTAGVLGDFRIIREIGRGGMGVVYEAEQISIGRTVALKVLPFAAMLDERSLARFRNEVRAAGQLHHTNIVPVYAVGAKRGVHFYAMQLVEGHSLAELITAARAGEPRNNSPAPSPRQGGEESGTDLGKPAALETQPVAALSTLRTAGGPALFRTVAQLGVQAAEALEHAHANGVVHRDIKPSNLLIDSRGALWLTDFGLARVESDASLTMTGDLLGTLRYMSPEQTRGSAVVLNHRTDVYSLGATLYELLALEPAFDAPTGGSCCGRSTTWIRGRCGGRAPRSPPTWRRSS
jgi:serine/threonine protein kinase